MFKGIKTTYLSFILFLFFAPAVFLRAQVIIKNFNAQPANSTQLLVSWTVDASSQSCSDLELIWSTDSFKTTATWLYTVPTICGTSGTDEFYYFQHNSPDTHGKNYYRLTSFAVPVSPIIVYNFGDDNGEYIISPNPLNDNSILSFKNPDGEEWIMDIANASCTKRYLINSITTDQFALPANWFDTGIYFFRLYSISGKLIKGKFVVMY